MVVDGYFDVNSGHCASWYRYRVDAILVDEHASCDFLADILR